MNTEPKIYSFDISLLPDANPKDGFCVDLVRVGDYASLKAERDALAVENAALKKFGDKLNEMHNDLNGEGTGIQGRAEVVCQQAAIEAAMDEFDAITTPATDAALAAIQAQGVEKALAVVSACRENICPGGLSENRQYEESIVQPHLDGIADELENLIIELREAK